MVLVWGLGAPLRTPASRRAIPIPWQTTTSAQIHYDAELPAGYTRRPHTAAFEKTRPGRRRRHQDSSRAQAAMLLRPSAMGLNGIVDSAPRPLEPILLLNRPGRRRAFLEPVLRDAGLPVELVSALDYTTLDGVLRAETYEALTLTGKDVGTPILHFRPPTGVAFFGPVMSRLPRPEEAGRLWDNVIGLATFPGFAELKRSLRERPQLASYGVDPEGTGIVEDRHGGSRRAKK